MPRRKRQLDPYLVEEAVSRTVEAEAPGLEEAKPATGPVLPVAGMCDTCVFYDDELPQLASGLCRRYPGRQPVRKIDWCGEYRGPS